MGALILITKILPGGAHAQVRIRIVTRIVVDVETVRVEVANVDGVAVGRLHLNVLFSL